MVDPTAFFLAVIGAPLLVTLATFWLVVPPFALVMGGPVYLIFAIPVLLWDIPRHEPTFARLAWLGFGAAMVVAALMALFGRILPASGLDQAAALYAIMGAIIGPLWGGFAAPLYLKFRRASCAQPIA
ncbi:hypothetical protein [Pseudooctadecabacter jejudonensis]|uniref:Uncharacterized protein n=1 Tax=Pseudooctadecabacter jejudonensis TaxID=1391910 RepID=A0A1Y5T295_9RHOB|nr:hypothetical protein [Pseudooctadecabacter jejudonensis]SLN53788.1 hypothetical protein PSJ8397_02803 [Pseudooctadecabacter jejudonensis]